MKTIDVLEMFTIYDRPSDFPDAIVVRRWTIRDGEPTADRSCVLCDSITDARDFCEKRGLTCVGRIPEDDAKIVETWL